MVPYRGRLALRIARLALALGCLGWYAGPEDGRLVPVLALVSAYVVYALYSLAELRFEAPARAVIALAADIAFFGFWSYTDAAGWTSSPAAGWIAALLCGYVLASAAVLHDLARGIAASVLIAALAAVFAPRGENAPPWIAVAAGVVAIAALLHQRYLNRRLSHTLRYNVIIRSQAQGARETERERMAADFHDGPLQSFIGFQMRLEVIKKLLARDIEAAAAEVRQLQDLCKSQVGELRGFVRSMRPSEDGASLPASFRRMVDQFQRDTGIAASFSSGDLHDPAETEVSLELLQIVREALNNIQKHSGATRLALSVGVRDRRLEIRAEDNGSGFPFAGSFSLDELELLRLGPASIKRRVRILGGELLLESRPGRGSTLQVSIPV
ncbi:MAG: sensor histidine kinase [Bryobacteraceae bacterium]